MHELHQWRDEVENTTPPCFARVLTVGPDVRCIAFHYWAWARQRNISFRDCIGSNRRFLCRERSTFGHIKHIPLANSVIVAAFN